MNLQQMDHLLAVVQTGSFSLAADKVHLTQPALSRSIQALEEELGAPLIDRLGKRKRLTPLGELVAARARRIHLEVTELKRSAALLTDMKTGSLRLGLGPAPAAVLAVPLFKHVLENYPGIKVMLSGGSSLAQVQALRDRTLDALVIHHRTIPANDDLNVELFPEMRLGFLARRKHPLLKQDRLTFARLRQYPLVASGPSLSDEAVRQLNAHFGKSVHFVDALHLQSEEVSCLVETVRTSHAAFFGVLAVADELRDRGDLVEIPLSPRLRMGSQFAFVTLDGIAEMPALDVVRRFCTARMRDRESELP